MWNQRANVLPNETRNGLAYSTDNGKISITGTVQGAPTYGQFDLTQESNFKRDGRKYLILLSQTLDVGVSGYGHASRNAFFFSSTAGTDWSGFIFMYVEEGETVSVSNLSLNVFDLTQMFGAGNEPSTLDDPRIKWIKDYANEYPEYNIGELISYNGSGIKTVGFNQFDKDNPSPVIHGYIDSTSMSIMGASNHSIYYIPCLPNTKYCVSRKAISTNDRFGIADMNDTPKVGGTINDYSIATIYQVVGNDMVLTLTTGANAKYLAIWAHWVNETDGTEALDTLCINFSWSGYRNGEYEPYWSRTLDLPISTYFPDGMKSAGSVRDELTKDKAVKRIGIVDLGTLNWTYNADSATPYFYTTLSDINGKPNNTNMMSSIYAQKQGFWNIAGSDMCVGSGNTYLNISNSTYTDAAAFKAAMSGVMLYYELAEPIETTITPPLDLTYKVADFGTEESITEGKSTPFIGIIKYSDDFTRGLVNMPKNYDTTASLDALAASLSAMLTSALDGTVTITRGAYDPATKKYEWSCQFTKNQVN